MVVLDIKYGILRKFYKYILVCIMTALIVATYIHIYNSLRITGKINYTRFSIADVWIYCFRGKFININKGSYEFPSVIYLLLQLIIAYTIGDYARKDYEERARYIVPRTGSRVKWIICKMVWILCVISLIYVCMLGIITLLCMLHPYGILSFSINQELAHEITDIELIYSGSMTMLFLKLFLMSYITSLALGNLQLMLSFGINSECGYMMIIIIIILSAYIRKPLCIGNAFMYVNTTYVSGGIINSMYITVTSCFIILLCNLVLIKRFKKIDIM